MKKIAVVLLLLCAAPLFAQNVRYDSAFPSITSEYTVPFLVANTPSTGSPVLAVCHSPANAVPCTNYATTYTSSGVACPNGAQDTPQPQPSACQSTGDAEGNIGFWAPAGTYAYTVCVNNVCQGPYTVTMGGVSLAASWWNNGDGSPYAFTPSSGNIGASADEILWYMFQISYSVVLDRISFRVNGGGGSGSKVGFAIYTQTGTTKIASWDAIDSSASTTNHTALLASPVTLPPGTYIFAFGRSGGTSVPNTDSGYATSGSSDPSESWNQGGFVRSGQAGNSLSAGVMPATLGTLSTTISMPGSFAQVTVSPN